MVFEPGMLARSKAGRDKGCIYVIIGVNAQYIYLADGKNKTVCRTKRKNQKHLQIIKKAGTVLPADDEGIRNVISRYSCLNNNENCKVQDVQEVNHVKN